MNISVDFNRHRKFVKLLSLAVTSVLLILILFPILAFYSGVFTNFIHLPSNIYELLHNFFYAAQFACAALAIRTRYKLLNQYLLRFDPPLN